MKNIYPASAQKILVTGGAGYIGSHTVLQLERANFSTVVMDDFSNSGPDNLDGLRTLLGRDVVFAQGDCKEYEQVSRVFREHGPFDAVIHFAAYKSVAESVFEPIKYYRNNLGSLSTVMEVMKENGVNKLVFSSSCSVYGRPEESPVTEETTLCPPTSPYAETKQICERMIEQACEADRDLKVAVLRYFNPIGAHESGLLGERPTDTPVALVPCVTLAVAGIAGKFTIYGTDYATPDGTCIRDFLHVSDLADAHIHAVKWLNKRPVGSGSEAFNIGTGRGYSIREVLNTFEEVTGHMVPHQIGDRRPGDVPSIFASADKAEQLLGWKARYSLAQALEHAWNRQQQVLQPA